MAKKTQQIQRVPAKKNPRRAQRVTARVEAAALATESEPEEPSSGRGHRVASGRGTTLRAVPTKGSAVAAVTEVAEVAEVADGADVAEPPAPPVRWGNLQRGAREVLGLFEERADELCFPGVTFTSLAEQADRIDRLCADVEKAKLELAAAQAAQQAAEAQLVDATKRAYAYAQVYAQEDAELKAALDAFVYASAEKPRRKKREVQEGSARGKRAAAGAAGDAPGHAGDAGEADD